MTRKTGFCETETGIENGGLSMLDSVNMKTTVTKDEFKKQSKKLEKELETLPQQIKQAQIPVIILFEGWGAAGKGSIISDLILNFDPRCFKVYSPPRTQPK